MSKTATSAQTESLSAKAPATLNRLRPQSFSLPGVRTRTWNVYPSVAHAPEDLIDPAYWAAISAKLTPGDRIFALAEDFSWAVDLLVTAATPTYAVVTPLGAVTRLNKPAKLANPERDNYEITMLAGSGFRVIRKADGLVITEAVSDRKAAERALDAYLDTIQRT